MEHRDKLAAPLFYRRYDRLARTVIHHFKRFPKDSRQSGDDTDLPNVWEEYKLQIQEGEGMFFDAYEDSLRTLCENVIAKLDADERRLLWLYSDAFIEWDEEDEPEPPYNDAGVVEELMQAVRDIAMNEEVRRCTPSGRMQRKFELFD